MTETQRAGAFDQAWEAHRSHLVDLAFRMLGDIGEAEDAVQEGFLRLATGPREQIRDERGWLTVVVSRLCLDRIRSARSRRERPRSFADADPGTAAPVTRELDPADRITLDDSVRLALVVLMEQLSPSERVVFVLHDVFQLPFEEITGVVGRSAATCRQLARRARQRIEADSATARFQLEPTEHRVVADRFIAACATGDFQGLVEILAPDASGGVDFGVERPSIADHGAENVARNLVRFWGPGCTLVSLPANRELVLLAFRERVLCGLVLITVPPETTQVSEVDVIVDPVRLSFLHGLLTASD